MSTLRLVLIALLSLTAGCRELGSYLSPEEVQDCLDGKTSEGCPAELDATSTVAFTQPEIAPGVINPVAKSRYVAVDAVVQSSLDMDRVDLQCGGLQLASWRPGRVKEVRLQGTVDLLPCRPVAAEHAPDPDGVVLHEIPLELAVYDALGARVLLGDLAVLANISDAQVPGADGGGALDPTRLGLSVFGAMEDDSLIAGEPIQLEVRSIEGIPLSAAPEVRVNGVRMELDFVAVDGGTTWIAEFVPAAPRYLPGASFAMMASGSYTISVRGIAEGLGAGIRQRTFSVDRERSRSEPDLLLDPVPFATSNAASIHEPVMTEAGLLIVGTYFSDAGVPQLRDPTGEARPLDPPIIGVGSFAFRGFTSTGDVVWESTSTAPEDMGWYLTVPDGQTSEVHRVQAFTPAVDQAFRLGNGSICTEFLQPQAACLAPSGWAFQCIGRGAGTVSEVIGVAPVGVGMGPSGLHAPLRDGWLSTAYEVPEPSCAPPQLAGRWGPAVQTHAFSAGYQPPDYGEKPDFVALPSGPSHAVVGHQDGAGLSLERFNAETGASAGTYFAGRVGLARPSAQDLLFATSDGGVWILSPGGQLSKWLPDASEPAATLDLTAWTGGRALTVPSAMQPIPDSSHPTRDFGRRVKGLPHVEHQDGSVTFALVDAASEPVVLELDASLRPVWAWSGSGPTGSADVGRPVAVYGLPDGPRVALTKFFTAYDPGAVIFLER